MADETPAAQGSQSNLPEYSVSELASQLKRAVEDAFPYVRVRGEISGLKFNTSGHVYFDLKDDKAVLNAVMWRTTAQRLRIKPEPGLEVVCTGRVSTYPASSRYQLIVDRMELAGLGLCGALTAYSCGTMVNAGGLSVYYGKARIKKTLYPKNILTEKIKVIPATLLLFRQSYPLFF